MSAEDWLKAGARTPGRGRKAGEKATSKHRTTELRETGIPLSHPQENPPRDCPLNQWLANTKSEFLGGTQVCFSVFNNSGAADIYIDLETTSLHQVD